MRATISALFPETLKDSEDYSVLVDLAEVELEGSRAIVRDLVEVLDLDNVPNQFLPILGEQYGLPYNPEKTLGAYRVALRVFLKIVSCRGTERALREFTRLDHILKYAEDARGVAIVMPFIWNVNYTIVRPAVNVFVLSRSKLSKEDAFQSMDYYRDGVIDIIAPQSVLDTLEPYIEYMRPAGVKIHWTVLVQVGGEIDIGEIPFLPLEPVYGYDFFLEDYFGQSEEVGGSLLSVHQNLYLSGPLTSIGLMVVGEVEAVGEELVRYVPATYSGKYFDENAYDGVGIDDSLGFEGQGVTDQVSEVWRTDSEIDFFQPLEIIYGNGFCLEEVFAQSMEVGSSFLSVQRVLYLSGLPRSVGDIESVDS